MNLFRKAKKAPTAHEAIGRMRDTLNMLEKKEVYLQSKMDNEVALAKKYMAAKDKQGAMRCLKKKKLMEAQINKLSGARMTIEVQVAAIEAAELNVITMKTMNEGAQTLRSLHNNMTIDDVDKTMDRVRDQMDLASEISDALAEPLGPQFDEDELLQELEDLERDTAEEIMQQIQAPAVPVGARVHVSAGGPIANKRVPVAVLDEDAEFRALEESMAV